MLVTATLVLASRARADHATVQVTATGQVAATDNLFSAGADGDREADMFTTVRPGVIYAYDAPRMIHDFAAEGEVTEYLIHHDQPSLSGHGGWHGLFLPGPRSELTMSIGAGTGVLTSLSSRTTSDQTSAVVAPAGKVNVDQADASESFGWIASQHTHVSQSVTGHYSLTNDGNGNTSETREVSGSLGFDRTFNHDTLLLNVGVSYLRLESSPAMQSAGTGNVVNKQLNPQATVSWRHDFNREWSASADGGLAFVHPLGTVTDTAGPMNMTVEARTVPFTIYGAQVAYSEAWGRASFSARRNVSPNLFLAENTLDDSVNATVAMPLPWLDDTMRNPKLAALASLGLGRTQVLDAATSDAVSSFDVAHLDVSVAWTPTFAQTYAVRYEFVYQTGDAAAKVAIPAYFRNSVYFTFALRYPDRSAGEVPKRDSVRSDRQDLRPLGLEPVVPDPLEPEGSNDR